MFPTGVFQENNPPFGAALFTGSRKSQPFATNFGPGRTEATSKVRLSALPFTSAEEAVALADAAVCATATALHPAPITIHAKANLRNVLLTLPICIHLFFRPSLALN